MIRTVRKTFGIAWVIIFLFGTLATAAAQTDNSISLTSLGTAYTQNFDSLSNSAESSALPEGWFMLESGSNANNLYNINTGTTYTADTYSFGSIDATERALGGIQGTALVPVFGASFTNNTGGTIESLTIEYTGEEWWLGKTSHIDRLIFEYRPNTTTLPDSPWIEFDPLSFLTPKNTGASLKNGNLTENRNLIHQTITGLHIEDGDTFWIRWRDFDAVGNDDGLAVDDFSITPNGTDNAPEVTGLSPADLETGVDRQTTINVTFSEPVSPAADWFSLICSKSGEHTSTVSGGPLIFTVTPQSALDYDETCTFTINKSTVSDLDITDPPDTMLNDATTSFTTEAEPDTPPVISAITPAADETGVLVDSILTIRFSEPVAIADGWASLTCATSGDHTFEVKGGPETYTLVPANVFSYNEKCTLTILGSLVNDLDGAPPDTMASNSTSSFTTQSNPDAAPYVATFLPVNNQTEVSLSQVLEVTFSEEVDAAGSWFEINCEKSGAHNAQVSGGNTKFLLTLGNPFAYDEKCTFAIKALAVTDLDSLDPPDKMETNQEISFQTAHEPDATPEITSTLPAQSATNVAAESNLILQFSEEVTVTGDWFALTCGGGEPLAVEVSGSGNSRTLNPAINLPYAQTCTLTVFAQQVKDLDENDPPDTLGQNYTLTFATEGIPDAPPEITGTYPQNGALDVPVSGNLQAVFSEPVTLKTGWIELACTKSGSHSITLNGGPREFSFGADSDFAYSEICTVTLKASSITDQDGNDPPDNPLQDYTFSFTTETDPEAKSYPVVLAGENTRPHENEVLQIGTHLLRVQFSKDVLHNGTDDAVDNPSNYRLVSASANQSFETTACGEAAGDDFLISIDQVDYDATTHVAELTVNQVNNLPNGSYQLIVCGAHTIRDLFGNALNDGANTYIRFTVILPTANSGDSTVTQPESNTDSPELKNSVSEKKSSNPTSALFIPVTGFPRGHSVDLSDPFVSYAELGDLWLEIPTLEIETPITGVPKSEGSWDVSWLGSQAGWLEGSAFPTMDGNSVLTGHVWDASNQPGIFYGIDQLQFGDQVIVHAWGYEYVYQVRENLSVLPDNLAAMLKHQETPWLTLVTCQGYDEENDSYRRRILVRAVLVEIR